MDINFEWNFSFFMMKVFCFLEQLFSKKIKKEKSIN
jgi:hypothetical protein